MIETNHLELKNMMCDFCAETIKRAIKSLFGVNQCEVNFAMKQVSIQYDTEQVSLEKIQQALASAGYTTQLLDESYQ